MAAKVKNSISTRKATKGSSNPASWIRRDKSGPWRDVRRDKRRDALPPPGPSNIIILTPNPLPPPRDVESQ